MVLFESCLSGGCRALLMLLHEGGVECYVNEQEADVQGPDGGPEKLSLGRVSLDMMAGEHLHAYYIMLNPRHDVPCLRVCLGSRDVQDAGEDAGDAGDDGNGGGGGGTGGTEGGARGWSLTEANTIMRFLCDSEGCLSAWYPRSIRLRAKVDEYLDWHIAKIRTPSVQVNVRACLLAPAPAPYASAASSAANPGRCGASSKTPACVPALHFICHEYMSPWYAASHKNINIGACGAWRARERHAALTRWRRGVVWHACVRWPCGRSLPQQRPCACPAHARSGSCRRRRPPSWMQLRCSTKSGSRTGKPISAATSPRSPTSPPSATSKPSSSSTPITPAAGACPFLSRSLARHRAVRLTRAPRMPIARPCSRRAPGVKSMEVERSQKRHVILEHETL